jgi:hypothetical protein
MLSVNKPVLEQDEKAKDAKRFASFVVKTNNIIN